MASRGRIGPCGLRWRGGQIWPPPAGLFVAGGTWPSPGHASGQVPPAANGPGQRGPDLASPPAKAARPYPTATAHRPTHQVRSQPHNAARRAMSGHPHMAGGRPDLVGLARTATALRAARAWPQWACEDGGLQWPAAARSGPSAHKAAVLIIRSVRAARSGRDRPFLAVAFGR